MNGRERIRNLLEGRPVDRTPVLASTLANAAWLRKIPQGKFHGDAHTLARTVIDVSDQMGLDGIYISSDNWILHEALGGALILPEDDEPRGVKHHLLDSIDELTGLRVPDPQRDGRMPMMLEAARKAVELADGRLFVEANIDSGPFQLALTLLGSEQAIMVALREPERFHDLLEFNTQVAIAYGYAMAQCGVDAIQFGESSASLVSSELYREMVLPYDQRLIAALKAEGVKVFLHVCGNSTHLLDDLEASGADCFELDAMVDLDVAFARIGNRIVLRGNVDTLLLLNGPVEEIHAAAARCMEKARAGGGRLILSPGCGVPKYTPAHHVAALVTAATRQDADCLPVGSVDRK
ncbi:MAG TPA: uroporphyrinogen decarboxylase family protein [Candidatus Hydrogenedentes bacterium]|nr:uroporphyrinogen decarboxylase family protein [Candidatus Hydrogenedentota bacterium]HPK02635.1 uroporphyrinogen decarboxylase family protein [Candidatus Sumerlaeota bacterium]